MKDNDSPNDNRPHLDGAEKLPAVEADPWWTPRKKALASILLAFHVFAVFASPCASPPPSSDTWQRVAGRIEGKDGWLSPYLRAAYLNHGYRFFAPNPGPSHLVRFEIDLESGGQIEGRFPDTDDDFPRLLYHRMFMLSETAFNLASPVLEVPPTDSLSEIERQEFDRQLAAADALADSIARQLLTQHQGKRVRLYLQTHMLASPTDVLEGRLDDPSFYEEVFWREISAQVSDLGDPRIDQARNAREVSR